MLRIDRMRAESSDRQPGRSSAITGTIPESAPLMNLCPLRHGKDELRLRLGSRILPGCLFEPFPGLLQILPDAAPIQVHLPD